VVIGSTTVTANGAIRFEAKDAASLAATMISNLPTVRRRGVLKMSLASIMIELVNDKDHLSRTDRGS
jgi:hypothetical protein